ncbi:hypothetical protein UPYG_G00058420 [Umbra pygmaea]|uniref:LITAF domain-containing protein n=1 Tax=Umbra pygmaea TaxID=75934 RepID=A0ABD0XCK2_UMBPY
MDTSMKSDEPFPTPPPYFLPVHGKAGDDMRMYSSPFSPHPSTPSLIANCYVNQTPSEDSKQDDNVKIYHINRGLPATPKEGFIFHTPSSIPAPSSGTHTPAFVQRYDAELGVSPGLTQCPSCQTRVMTDVTFHAGTFAWVMCLLFIVCGFILGCCLIPFLFRHFKDTYHTCPRCRMVLHIHKKTCCPLTSET